MELAVFWPPEANPVVVNIGSNPGDASVPMTAVNLLPLPANLLPIRLSTEIGNA